MTNQIKNFIEEGEKELKDSLLNEWGVDNRASDSFDNWIIKKFSSRQISLIKIIVEMVESEKKKYSRNNYDGNNLKTAEDYYGISALDWKDIIRLEDGANQSLYTILSKLKELYDQYYKKIKKTYLLRWRM